MRLGSYLQPSTLKSWNLDKCLNRNLEMLRLLNLENFQPWNLQILKSWRPSPSPAPVEFLRIQPLLSRNPPSSARVKISSFQDFQMLNIFRFSSFQDVKIWINRKFQDFKGSRSRGSKSGLETGANGKESAWVQSKDGWSLAPIQAGAKKKLK